MNVIVREYQTLTDIAVQVYGSSEAVVLLASENGKEITDELSAGQVLSCPAISDSTLLNPEIADYYKKNKLHPVTAFKVDPDARKRIFDDSFCGTFN